MKPTQSVHAVGEIDAPAQAVWERVSDHANTHTWVLVARVRLLTPGVPPPNGLGAVREVAFPERRMWTTIQERVTAFDAPRSFSYTIIKGMPGLRDHIGSLTVEPLGEDRSRLTWHVDFVFARWHPMGWIAGSFSKAFGLVLQAAIHELGRQMRR
jgi:Polyketide cyclase / dehydrase and lipid transport